jgi:hypothetical protein
MQNYQFTFIKLLYFKFTSIFLFNYLGWYIMLFTSLDSLAISIYFVFALLNRPKFLIRKKHNKNMQMMVNNVLPAPAGVEHLAKNRLFSP